MATNIPTTSTQGVVQAGDTASQIASRAGMTPSQFLALNPTFAASGNQGDYQGLTGLIRPGQTYNLASQQQQGGTPAAAPVEERDANGLLINPPGALYDRNTGKPLNSNATLTSTSAGASITALGDDIKGLEEKYSPTGANTASADFQAEIQRQMDENTRMSQDAVRALEEKYAESLRVQGERQKRDYGGQRTNLLGATVGYNSTVTGVLQNLQSTFDQEKRALESQRDAAISQARNAYSEKNNALALKKAEEAKVLENTLYERQRDFAAEKLALAKEARAQTEFDMGITDKKIEAFSTMSDEEFNKQDAGTIASLDKPYFAGYTKTLQQLNQKAEKAKAEDNKFKREKYELEMMNDLQDLINKTPAGKMISYQGKTYVGVKTEKKEGGSGTSIKDPIPDWQASQLGIPNVAGMSQSDIIESLFYTNPPLWYMQLYKNQNPQGWETAKNRPDILKSDWEIFRNQDDFSPFKNTVKVDKVTSNKEKSDFDKFLEDAGIPTGSGPIIPK